jgi:hypothetical protein
MVCAYPIEFWVGYLPLEYDRNSYTDNAIEGHTAAVHHCMVRLGPCCGAKFRDMDVGNWLEEMMSLFSELTVLWERGLANNVSRPVLSDINSVYREWVNNMGKLATDDMPENLGECNLTNGSQAKSSMAAR